MKHINNKALNHTQIGRLGENIVVRKLQKLGYILLTRNYRKRYGEIDIICRRECKDSVEPYFVEVKPRPCSGSYSDTGNNPTSHNFRLEDNIHELKLLKIKK